MDEFVPMNKHMKCTESKIQIHPVRRTPKKWLDIGVTNLNHIDEFVPITKHMKGRESKIQSHLVRKNPKK